MQRILLVDDDQELCELLSEYLTPEQFQVDAVHRGDEALSALRSRKPDIVILDVMLPGLSGTEVLRRLREESSVPVLMLTARGEDVDRIVGLELGADDYLPKPFNPRELLARLRAVLRRGSVGSPDASLRVGDLALNPAQRQVSRNEDLLELTSTEFSLLEVLMRRAGEVIPKQQLYEAGLGRELGPYDRALDMHLSNLRRKLGPAPDGGSRIETVRGVGYLLKGSRP